MNKKTQASLQGLNKKRFLFSIFILSILIVASIVFIATYINNKAFEIPGPYRDGDNWTLILEDNFYGDSINESIWSYGYPPYEYNCYGQCHNHQGWMTPENVIVENGLLRIKGENKTHPDAPIEHYWGNENLPLNYTTGAITSFGKFNFTYGYLEAKQKMPEGPTGFWPAFWTFNTETPGIYGEIDIMEWLSGETNQYHTALHTHGIDEELVSKGGIHKNLPNLTAEFHVYGVEWHPNRISFYFDDKEVGRITNKNQIEHLQQQHIRINLAIGGWASSPDENTIWPAWYETDWVKLWQFNEYM